jgi:hypothetical protein
MCRFASRPHANHRPQKNQPPLVLRKPFCSRRLFHVIAWKSLRNRKSLLKNLASMSFITPQGPRGPMGQGSRRTVPRLPRPVPAYEQGTQDALQSADDGEDARTVHVSLASLSGARIARNRRAVEANPAVREHAPEHKGCYRPELRVAGELG